MTELDGVVAMDLETVHEIVKGGQYNFGAPWELVVSVACTYSLADGHRDWFGGAHRIGAPDISKMADYLADHEKVVTFNGVGFDFRVVDGHLQALGKPPELMAAIVKGKHVDMFKDIRKAAGKMIALGKVALATLGEDKIEHGANAPQLWADGKRLEVIEYCRDDTCKTFRLYQHGLEEGAVSVAPD